jgi:signal transduction histidine kinase
MKPGGTHVQTSPESDVALRPPAALAWARAGRRPAGSAVVQTAVLGSGLAVAGGLVTAHSAYVARPVISGLSSAAVIAGMTAVGCIALHRGIERRLWLVLVALGLYAATTLDATSAPVLDAVGHMAWAGVLVIAVYVLLSFSERRLPDKSARALVIVTAVASAAVWGALLATAERLPEFLPTARCDAACPHNPLRIVHGGPALTDALGVATWWLTATALVGVAVALACRLPRASSISRRATFPILASVIAVAAPLAAAAVARASGGSPSSLERLGSIWAVTVLAVPCAFLVAMLGARVFAGGALERLVDRLSAGAADVSVRGILAEALGDPSLTVAFRRSEQDEFVDAGGRVVPPPVATPSRSVTAVRRDGAPLAVIVHDAALDVEPGLVSSAGGAALMMLENERLEADLRASAVDLRASRARLARAADAGRREIERDLHDGAQRRLVSLRLKLADAEAHAASDDDLRRSLGELGADAEATLEELRSLARGVYPAVLVDHGLAHALTSVANRAPLPVRVEAAALGRLPPEIEATVYFCCLEAIQNAAKHAGSGAAVTVSVRAHSGRVVFEVRDDGVGFDADAVPAGQGLTNLGDRVATVAGTVHIASSAGHGTTVCGDLPARV